MQRIYEILVAGIQPRPISFVSTISAAGKPNLAPFSFFMPGGADPPSLIYSATLNSAGAKKNSLKNVEQTGEFVANMATRPMADGMNAYTLDQPDRYNEWEACGFTQLPSDLVQPKRVGESPVQFECKLFKIIQHGTSAGAAQYVIGEVVRIHVSESVWNGSAIDPLLFRPLARMGGPHYLDTDSLELFRLEGSTDGQGTS